MVEGKIHFGLQRKTGGNPLIAYNVRRLVTPQWLTTSRGEEALPQLTAEPLKLGGGTPKFFILEK